MRQLAGAKHPSPRRQDFLAERTNMYRTIGQAVGLARCAPIGSNKLTNGAQPPRIAQNGLGNDGAPPTGVRRKRRRSSRRGQLRPM